MPERGHTSAIAEEIARYLATGSVDGDGWCLYPGQNFVEKTVARASVLRGALLQRVIELEAAGHAPPVPDEQLEKPFLWSKLRPMVEGLFAVDEQEHMLELVTDSVVFLTQDTVHRLLRELRWHSSAWKVATIWLDSINAPALSSSSPALLGFSEEARCYVSLRYFGDFEDDPFADYVVHEVAHLFHNNKRHRIGLPPRGRCEWLLDIEFRKRELFAHACEFYSRISTRASGRREREELVEAFAPHADGFADRLEPEELVDVLRAAARARNGWRAILRGCAPAPRRRAVATRST